MQDILPNLHILSYFKHYSLCCYTSIRLISHIISINKDMLSIILLHVYLFTSGMEVIQLLPDDYRALLWNTVLIIRSGSCHILLFHNRIPDLNCICCHLKARHNSSLNNQLLMFLLFIKIM